MIILNFLKEFNVLMGYSSMRRLAIVCQLLLLGELVIVVYILVCMHLYINPSFEGLDGGGVWLAFSHIYSVTILWFLIVTAMYMPNAQDLIRQDMALSDGKASMKFFRYIWYQLYLIAGGVTLFILYG